MNEKRFRSAGLTEAFLVVAILAMGSTSAASCQLASSSHTPFFPTIPNNENRGSHALEVEVVSISNGTMADIPPPDGGWPKGRRLNGKIYLVLSKLIRVISGKIDQPTLQIVEAISSCGWGPKVGEKGIIFGAVRRSHDGTVFFFPSELRTLPSLLMRESGAEHGLR